MSSFSSTKLLILGLVSLFLPVWFAIHSKRMASGGVSHSAVASGPDQIEQTQSGTSEKPSDRPYAGLSLAAGMRGQASESHSEGQPGLQRRGPGPDVSEAHKLIEELKSSRDPEAKIRAIHQLGRSMHLIEVRQALTEALKDPKEPVRMAALNLLAATSDSTVPLLLSEVEKLDPSPAVRNRAADLLEYISTARKDVTSERP